ncbi:hypothetical protein [Microbacterium ulmi]|uniref:Uncharacterized protein n=1 Tax=Microbacterium ulmi TaxID=179095 RepID=A0A7Y2M347_9MICO|nr:hypothetical protein [Microbacterium ulmi]NII69117.1 hypothetical protein [Microbacterium ulmi]NNH05164.1 hypothetical protein [Microbacterium ulmi]
MSTQIASEAQSPVATARTARTGEKTAWWITFSVLTLALVLMLGLWN